MKVTLPSCTDCGSPRFPLFWSKEGFKGKKLTLNEHNNPVKRPDCLEQKCVPRASKFIISLCSNLLKCNENRKSKSHDIPYSQRLVIASPYWQHLLITICSVVGWWLFMQKHTHHWHVLKNHESLLRLRKMCQSYHIVLIFPAWSTESTTKMIHIFPLHRKDKSHKCTKHEVHSGKRNRGI